ncbi:LysR substrate-binding domain-containing protein [Shewanella saliphila]|uniref:LysR substrate-binding domain-containing protein n=1 Tax=Shewanella saliphila TaxID=2282698 RepID=UPI00166E18C2
MPDKGITQLPSFYVDKDIANYHLVDILSNFAPAPLPINLLYPSQRLISPAIKALIEFLVDFLRLHAASH